MNLTPITSRSEVRAAFRLLKSSLTQNATRLRRNVGWPSGDDEFTLYWHEKQAFWVVFGFESLSRYWCAYGTANPTDSRRSLPITCEINPPLSGINRGCGGLFLKDSAAAAYLSHSGKKLVAGERESAEVRFLSTIPTPLEKLSGPTDFRPKLYFLERSAADRCSQTLVIISAP